MESECLSPRLCAGRGVSRHSARDGTTDPPAAVETSHDDLFMAVEREGQIPGEAEGNNNAVVAAAEGEEWRPLIRTKIDVGRLSHQQSPLVSPYSLT